MKTDNPTPRLGRFKSYATATRHFRWPRLDRFNIAEAVLRRHDDAQLALIEVKPAGENIYTFGAMDFFSDKFANTLAAAGMKQTDALAVMLPQSAALAVAHLGALKLGCAVVPLADDLSAREVEYAITDSKAKAIVMSRNCRFRLGSILNSKSLEAVFVAGHLDEDLTDRNFWREVYAASSDFAMTETRGDAPAFIFYEADKAGIVHGHSLLAGSLPAFEMINNFDLDDAVFYTPLKWAYAETLFGLLYPAWFYELPVVACQSGSMLAVAERYRVTNLLVSSAGLEEPEKRYDLRLRNIYSINETLPGWAGEKLGARIARACGTLEAPMITATCERWFSAPMDSCGRAAPGHRVRVIDESGRPSPPGKIGRIAIGSRDPSLFLRRSGDQFAAREAGEWLPLARGFRDEDGSLWLAPIEEQYERLS